MAKLVCRSIWMSDGRPDSDAEAQPHLLLEACFTGNKSIDKKRKNKWKGESNWAIEYLRIQVRTRFRQMRQLIHRATVRVSCSNLRVGGWTAKRGARTSAGGLRPHPHVFLHMEGAADGQPRVGTGVFCDERCTRRSLRRRTHL